MRSAKTVLMSLLLSIALLGLAEAQNVNKLFDTLKGITGKADGHKSADGSTIAQGLKEALRVGAEKAVASTGKEGGFSGNPLIKIMMPEKLQSLEKGLRLAGFGPKVDEFVISMNHAAERAAPQAKSIFVEAITSMTFSDANKILGGGDTAATEFFKEKTSKNLYDTFRPVVDSNMNKLGTVERYNALAGQAKNIPFLNSQNLDVGDYVTNKALSGLFQMVAEEEKGIRTDPAARITPLLKQVFGN